MVICELWVVLPVLPAASKAGVLGGASLSAAVFCLYWWGVPWPPPSLGSVTSQEMLPGRGCRGKGRGTAAHLPGLAVAHACLLTLEALPATTDSCKDPHLTSQSP